MLVGDGPEAVRCCAEDEGPHLNSLRSRSPTPGLCVPAGALFCCFPLQACLGECPCSGFFGRSVCLEGSSLSGDTTMAWKVWFLGPCP